LCRQSTNTRTTESERQKKPASSWGKTGSKKRKRANGERTNAKGGKDFEYLKGKDLKKVETHIGARERQELANDARSSKKRVAHRPVWFI